MAGEVGLCVSVTQAAVLRVGADQQYTKPSAAIAAAHDGDSVLIEPGTYYDCAIVRHNNLTIAGSGPGAVLSDLACAGKALLVIDGHNITVRNLTLARARVPDGNGAGIRAEGHSLTVDNVEFINDEYGILAASDPGGTIDVRDSLFRRDGVCHARCGYGLEVNSLGLLRVVHSSFEEAGGGSHISSAARTTELVNNTLTDAGVRPAEPLVLIKGGALGMLQNTVTLDSTARRRPGAVLIAGHATRIAVRGNILHEVAGQTTPLLRNWTGQHASAADNVVPTDVAAVSDDGALYHRVRARLAALRDSLRAAAGRAKHLLGFLVHRIE